MGRSSEAKNRKSPKKVKCDGRTDGPTDGPTKRGVESRNTRLKIYPKRKTDEPKKSLKKSSRRPDHRKKKNTRSDKKKTNES